MVEEHGLGESGRALYGPEPLSILIFSKSLPGVKTSPPPADEGFPDMLLLLLLLFVLLPVEPVLGFGVSVAVVESNCCGGSILDKFV